MLPPRAYTEALPPFSANLRTQPSPSDSRPPLIVAVALEDIDRFPAAPFARHSARTTAETVRLIERWRPRLIAIDWDLKEFDPVAICAAARHVAPVSILAIMESPSRAPAAIKAGCHAVLLKPFSLNLAAARLGRLCREMPAAAAVTRLGATVQQWGTNRVWPEMHCPQCIKDGAVCFEYASHRRSWYACLACDHTWLGARRE
jgi:CheY-like chemotaxis protein